MNEQPVIDITMPVIRLDKTAVMMLNLYWKTEALEPPVPQAENLGQYEYEEASMNHYEWSRHLSAIRLMLSQRLIRLALDHLPKFSAGLTYEDSIDALDLSVRAYNVLKREGVNTIGEMVAIYDDRGMSGFYDMRNLGHKAGEEILGHLQRLKGEVQ